MALRHSTLPKVLLLAALAIAVVAGKEALLYDAQANEPKLWALLVSGSKGYEDYRHQADICHAYQVLKNHGVPDERIVVMMYDDIAYNPQNPTRGVIINHPSGSNVYPGVPKDYTGKLVTPQNFLDILQGKKVKGGSGKVIASGPNDHVFVNFVGHGAQGLFVFPNDMLYAEAFANVIQDMHRRQKFSKMVIYAEACESGSMFQTLLPKNVNVYATTAANSHEPSYACYLDKLRGVYIGDVYSVKWMEDSDIKDLHKETLLDQFRLVQKKTTRSHVMEYGDLTIAWLPLSDFQGAKRAQPIVVPEEPCFPVSNREVRTAILWEKLRKASSPASVLSIWTELRLVLRKRDFLHKKVVEIVRIIAEDNEESAEKLMNMKQTLRKFDCYECTVRHFGDNCFNLHEDPYGLGHLHVLINMCEVGYGANNIIRAMNVACRNLTAVDIV